MSAPLHIFRMPAGCPELTYDALLAYLGGEPERCIGTTVTVRRLNGNGPVRLELYGLCVAEISGGSVLFTEHGDRHQATREWLVRVIADNGIGYTCWRSPKAGYVRGTGSPLCVDGNPEMPVEGHSYPVRRKAA